MCKEINECQVLNELNYLAEAVFCLSCTGDKDDAIQDNVTCEIDNVTDHLPPANALKAAIDAVPKNSF